MPKISDADRRAKASKAILLAEGLKSSISRSTSHQTSTRGGTVQAATGRSRDVSPNLGGQKAPRLCLTQPKSVTQLRKAQAALDELEDQESLPFVDPYAMSKIPEVEKAQPSTQIYGTPESSWQAIGPPKIKYLTGFQDDKSGFSGFSRPVIQLDENIQDVPSGPLGRIDLGDIMKDVDTNMNILKSTEEPDWVPQGFLEDDEDDLFEKEDNNQDREATQHSSEDNGQDEKDVQTVTPSLMSQKPPPKISHYNKKNPQSQK